MSQQPQGVSAIKMRSAFLPEAAPLTDRREMRTNQTPTFKKNSAALIVRLGAPGSFATGVPCWAPLAIYT